MLAGSLNTKTIPSRRPVIASGGKEWVQTANAPAQQGQRAAEYAERSQGSEEPWLKPRGVFSILQTCESVGESITQTCESVGKRISGARTSYKDQIIPSRSQSYFQALSKVKVIYLSYFGQQFSACGQSKQRKPALCVSKGNSSQGEAVHFRRPLSP